MFQKKREKRRIKKLNNNKNQILVYKYDKNKIYKTNNDKK